MTLEDLEKIHNLNRKFKYSYHCPEDSEWEERCTVRLEPEFTWLTEENYKNAKLVIRCDHIPGLMVIREFDVGKIAMDIGTTSFMIGLENPEQPGTFWGGWELVNYTDTLIEQDD